MTWRWINQGRSIGVYNELQRLKKHTVLRRVTDDRAMASFIADYTDTSAFANVELIESVLTKVALGTTFTMNAFQVVFAKYEQLKATILSAKVDSASEQ